jgi:hypothetical protein
LNQFNDKLSENSVSDVTKKNVFFVKNGLKECCHNINQTMKENTYYQKNQEKLRAYALAYKDANKEAIAVRRRETVPCPMCQKILSRDSMFHHRRIYHTEK